MKNKFFLLFILITSLAFSQEAELSVTLDPESHSKKITSQIHKVYAEVRYEIEKKLKLSAPKEAHIVVCNNIREMENLIGQSLPSWVLGLAISSRNTILINKSKLDILSNNLSSVLKHEVCHLYLGKWEKENNLDLPQWFNEGICEWISGRLHFEHANKIFENAVWDNIIPLADLENGFPTNAEKAALAYVQSRDVVKYIVDTYEEESISEILDIFAKEQSFSVAIEEIASISLETLEKEWVASITPSFKWFWRLTQLFSAFSIMAILVFLAYMKQQKKKREVIEQWEEEDTTYENIGN